MTKGIVLDEIAKCEKAQFLLQHSRPLWANAFEKLDRGVEETIQFENSSI